LLAAIQVGIIDVPAGPGIAADMPEREIGRELQEKRSRTSLS
jgi:hypothetical protein